MPGRLHRGELVTLVGGVLIMFSLLMPWLSADPGDGELAEQALAAARAAGFDIDRSGFEALQKLDVFLMLTAGAALWVAISAIIASRPAGAVIAAVVTVAISFFAVLFVIYRMVNEPGNDAAWDLRWGAWATLAGTLGVLVGAMLTLRDDGTGWPESKAQSHVLLEQAPPRPAPQGEPPAS